MKIKKILLALILALITVSGCDNDNVVTTNSTGTNLTSSMESKFANDWIEVTYRIMCDQQPNPCKCSRILSYVSVSIYESVRFGIPSSRSMTGQLREMPDMPGINANLTYDWPSVITGSTSKVCSHVLDTLFQGSSSLIQQTYNSQYQERESAVGKDVVDRSVAYGEQIADKILEWAGTDQYRETRTMVYVIPPRSINRAFWEPINIGDRPTEPFWGLIRPFILAQPDACTIHYTDRFDSVPGNIYYEEAEEVRQIGASLTEEQRRIAVFWNDKLRTGTPPGHWFMIAHNIIEDLGLKLDRAAQIYLMLGIVSRDAFIACWKEKYAKNLLRPETYIRDWITPNFYAYIQTPSFPEYPSGHSTVSGGCAEVLTRMIGNNFNFTDRTHIELGYGTRTFSSFYQARDEAGMSRLYGGIHFMHANVNGKAMGGTIANYAFEHVRLFVTP